jgi:hypothetical protein
MFFSLLFIRQRIVFHQQVMSFTFQIPKKWTNTKITKNNT